MNPVSSALAQGRDTLNSVLGAKQTVDWVAKLQTGSFGGVTFDVTPSRDLAIGHRVSDTEIPFSAKGSFQALGAKKRAFSVELVLAGPDYPARRDALIALIESGEPHEYIDPWRGIVKKALARDSHVKENRVLGKCDITIDFTDETEPVTKSTDATRRGKQQSLLADCISALQAITREASQTVNMASASARVVTAAALRVSGAVRDALAEIEGSLLDAETAAYEAYAAALQIRDDYASFGARTKGNFTSSPFGGGSSSDVASALSDVQAALDIPAPISALTNAALIMIPLEPALTGASTAARIRENSYALDLFFSSSLATLAAKAVASWTPDTYEEALAVRDSLCAALVATRQGVLAARVYDLLTSEFSGLATMSTRETPVATSIIEIAQEAYGDPERAVEIMKRNKLCDACCIQGAALRLRSA